VDNEITPYSERLSLLYGLCLAESGELQSPEDMPAHDAQDAATYLACYITFKAIQELGRSPAEEREHNFDSLSVYQAFAMLVFVYLTLPLREEDIIPDIPQGAIVIAKTLFAELSDEALAECVESGARKFQLIGDAEQEHLMNYRQDLDKAVVSFVIVGTDDNAPFDKEEIIPLFGTMLGMLCEAFAG
jgi:hypothetical protein